jgi:heat shock protein HslJ
MKIYLLIAAFFFTMQCSKKKQAEVIETIDNTWQLVELTGFTHKLEGPKGAPVLTINMSDSTYNGNSGCNSYSGKLGFGKSGVSANPGLMTKMACEDNGLEMNYMNALHSATSFKLVDNKLNLYKKGTLLAVFRLKE